MAEKTGKQVAILWGHVPITGAIQVKNGAVTGGIFAETSEDSSTYADMSFQTKEASDNVRLELTVEGSVQTGSGRIILSFPEQERLPDGMSVDEEGMIWVA